MVKKVLFFIVAVLLFAACSNRTVFSDYTELDGGVWATDKSFAFNVEIEDTAASYEIDLMLRNTDVFPRQNLWLKVEQEHNGHPISVDTLNIFLLDHNGKWIGKGLCSKYDNEFIWKQQVRFPENGSYIFRFSQLMRIQVLEGIENIGIEVIKEKQ